MLYFKKSTYTLCIYLHQNSPFISGILVTYFCDFSAFREEVAATEEEDTGEIILTQEEQNNIENNNNGESILSLSHSQSQSIHSDCHVHLSSMHSLNPYLN